MEPPDPLKCASGVGACGNCAITSSQDGTLYCCAEDCDHGGIETGSTNGVSWCRCYHD